MFSFYIINHKKTTIFAASYFIRYKKMKTYKIINNITGWAVFVVALVTYLLTIEPTASFWDCGEFISCAYQLDVGHPPGAPFFMIFGRFATLFASDPTHVAMMVNALSATFSALTILFLFWTITHLARKIIIKKENGVSLSQIIGIMGAGTVGALAYTFSDTFWFSAVEGEVYAFSSLFTAVVVWAILKWEDIADEAHSERWLIFIAYLTGLSIGVHLLNLLTIPAIVLVYYFRKYEYSVKGVLLALLVSFAIVGVVMFGFIPGSIEVAGWFDLFFVNTLGLSYNSGAIVYVMLTLAILSWSIYEGYTGKNNLRMKISFLLTIIMLGIPFIGNSILLPVLIIGGLIFWLWKKGLNQRWANLIVVSLSVLFIGYLSYTVTIIRSIANPPMDQNSPNNVFALKSYLNREQYGETPLFYGQYYSSEVLLNTQGQYCVPVYNEGETIWVKDTVKGGKDRYVGAGKKTSYVYVPEHCTVFPRMYSTQPNHIEGYKAWANIEGTTLPYNKCGRQMTVVKPTFAENLRYFFRYQVNFMYWRYFMWNFSGRQNDIQGHGEIQNGNWISGISFIDNIRLGDQSDLPPDMADNKAHNKYYLLPLLLGIIGIFYQLTAGKRGKEKFWITFLLFFMTGLAIVAYLNQPPYQPRERDYAYAGSFYAFAIWIGFGVLGIIKLLETIKLPKTIAAAVATVAAMGVPALMASENWDDHDRSVRRACADFGYNYLASCAPNAIIFTMGDNDTFPLWYMQEVEGFRRDVRVCNLSYLQTDWYIDQMKRQYYNSAPLPIKMERDKYAENTRTVSAVNSKNNPINEALIDQPIELWKALDFFNSNDPRAKDRSGDNYIPSQNLYINVDTTQVINTSSVKESERGKISPVLPIRLGNRLIKNEYAILDMLNNNNWERPIYYAITVGDEANLGLRNFSRNEGLARRIIPVRQNSGNAIDADAMYENMVHKFRWGNVENPKIYLDPTNMSMYHTSRMLFGQLAEELIRQDKKDKALETLDYSMKVIPRSTVPSSVYMVSYAELYYRLGEKDKAEDVATELLDKTIKNLAWFFKLGEKAVSAIETQSGNDIKRNLGIYQELLTVLDKNDKTLHNKYNSPFDTFYQLYYLLSRLSDTDKKEKPAEYYAIMTEYNKLLTEMSEILRQHYLSKYEAQNQ